MSTSTESPNLRVVGTLNTEGNHRSKQLLSLCNLPVSDTHLSRRPRKRVTAKKQIIATTWDWRDKNLGSPNQPLERLNPNKAGRFREVNLTVCWSPSSSICWTLGLLWAEKFTGGRGGRAETCWKPKQRYFKKILIASWHWRSKKPDFRTYQGRGLGTYLRISFKNSESYILGTAENQ